MLDLLSVVVGLASGGAVAACVGVIAWRAGRAGAAISESTLRVDLSRAQTQIEERQRAFEFQQRQFDSARADEARLAKEFEGLSARALDENTRKFLQMAAQALAPVEAQLRAQLDGQLGKHQESITGVVKPLESSLKEMQALVRTIEEARNKAYGGLEAQLQGLLVSAEGLRRETGALAGAMRNSQAKGHWGEVALRNLVELAGLTEHADFETQVSLGGMDEKVRPDLVITLPSHRVIPVDSKMSSAAYLRALEAPDDAARDAALDAHAAAVLGRIKELSAKDYASKLRELGNVPEFVIMFIPGDNFFAAALARDPTLFEEAVRRNVMLASPTVLLPLLRVVEIGWRQERLLENIDLVRDQARELYDRLVTMTGHLQKLGNSLNGSVEAYNSFVGSYESRVLVQARRFKAMGIDGARALPNAIAPVEPILRRLVPDPAPDEPKGES